MVKCLNENEIEWREGVPIAPGFDDVYYSLDNGLEETEFVFLKGTGAPEAWQSCGHYVIAETGFGTGLNFLATYKKWLETGAKGRLTFVSVEGFPLSVSALEKAHKSFPELAYYAEQLRAAWPPPSPGFHPRFFEGGKIQLLLLFGEAVECYRQLDAEVDAWFLDGFTPAKNPAMWSDALFDQIARLSKPGTRFATFTASGFVKRGLADRGFKVAKTAGYGRKRERLVGTMNTNHTPGKTNAAPEWSRLGSTHEGPTTIIGAGIAGRSLAAALARRGMEVSLIAGKRPTGSHVPSAILAPAFQAGEQPTTPFTTASFAQACWLPAYADAWAAKRGVEVMAVSSEEKKRQKRIFAKLGWSQDWLRETDQGLYYPRTGSINTALALNTTYSDTLIEPGTIERIKKTSCGWAIYGALGVRETANLILATGPGTEKLIPGGKEVGFTSRAGQIEFLCENHPDIPARSLAASGYITAPIAGQQTLGSTFSDHEDDPVLDPAISPAATKEILEKIETEFGASIPQNLLIKSWASLRAATTDYTPVIGPIPDWGAALIQYAPLSKDRKITGLGDMPYQEGLYAFAGFGSKGYQQAPYAAEYLAAHLTGDPLTMAQNVAAYLHPARLFIRRLVRSGAQ